MDISYEITEQEHGTLVTCSAVICGATIGYCSIYVDIKMRIFIISSWHVSSKYSNHGLGKTLLIKTVSHLITIYGYPREIEYIWDGINEYIYIWMRKHFDAVSKYQIITKHPCNDDIWDSYIYILNVNKFLSYLGV